MAPEIRLVFIAAGNVKDFAKRFRQFAKHTEFLHLIKSGYREAGFKVEWNEETYYSIRMNDADENTLQFFVRTAQALGLPLQRYVEGTFADASGNPIGLDASSIEEY